MPDNAIVSRLLDKYGQTFSDEHDMRVADNTPSPLFQLLIFSLLSATKVDHGIASDAFDSLKREGWITAEKMADATWAQRRDALARGRYGQYDEQHAGYLGEVAELCVDKWQGDLRKLRDAADRDPARERELIREFKGIADVGCDLFFREAQAAWDEHRGFCDQRAKTGAGRLGLDAGKIPEYVAEKDVPRLIASLVRVDLEDAYDEIRG